MSKACNYTAKTGSNDYSSAEMLSWFHRSKVPDNSTTNSNNNGSTTMLPRFIRSSLSTTGINYPSVALLPRIN